MYRLPHPRVPLILTHPSSSLYTVCSYPVEYCEFGSSITRCKEWLHGAHPALYNKYWSEGAFHAI
jgi:hypothetical protein